MSAIPRDQDQRGEIARKADGRGPANALAGSRDDSVNSAFPLSFISKHRFAFQKLDL